MVSSICAEDREDVDSLRAGSLHSSIGCWWSQLVVMVAHHSYLWWRWWPDTLWVALTRLWLSLILVVLVLVLARSDNICLVGSHVFLEYLSRITEICTSCTDMHTHTSLSLLYKHRHTHELSSCYITTEQVCSLNYQSLSAPPPEVSIYTQFIAAYC